MKLKELLEDIIESSFPELMNEDIQIEYKNLEDALMEQGGLTGHGYYIEVDNTLKKAPEKVITGGLVHKLCHILTDTQLGKRKSMADRLAYKISKRYKTLDERNTDLQVIIRGYGKQLLSFMEYSAKEGYDFYQEDGLSILEIKNILKA